MTTRKNIYELGGDWADPILWYARGVKILKQRLLADRTSWRFYAAIHGFNERLWQTAGYFSAADALPSDANVKLFWKQCQHGSWYFLPWHRGYLIGFETTVRAAIIGAGGPVDWALPYWNYFKHGQDALPPAFASANWPDGTGDNPLFVKHRYGPRNDGKVFVPLDAVNLQAMNDDEFTGVDSGGGPGFGGIDTGFSHGGRTHGDLELQPHDYVHGLVGGADPKSHPDNPTLGLMSHPDIAGLDPIFWLHHANIDRLWEVWRHNPPSNANPTDANWVNGPSERAFVMPMPDGTTWTYTPGGMIDLAVLGYTYDDLAPALEPAPFSARIAALQPGLNVQGISAMTHAKITELVGASPGAVAVHGNEVHLVVHLDVEVRKKVVATLRAASATAHPDRVFLNFENVRGKLDSAAFHVYVGLPPTAPLAGSVTHKAGSIALFGVSKASLPDEEHGGQGINFVLDITRIVDAMYLAGALDVQSLDVRIVPVMPIPKEAEIKVGRVSIVRQSST